MKQLAANSPAVDGTLVDCLAYSGDTIPFLRGVESSLRQRSAILEDLLVGGPCIARMRVVRERLQRFLDAPDGELRKALRRPPWQLGSDGVVRVRLDRIRRKLVEDIEQIVEMHAGVRDLITGISSLKGCYDALFPNILAGNLSRSGLTSECVDRLYSMTEVSSATRRLQRVVDTLGELLGALQSSLSPVALQDLLVAVDSEWQPQSLTRIEFRALSATAIRGRVERRRSVGLGSAVSDQTAVGLLRVVAAVGSSPVDAASANRTAASWGSEVVDGVIEDAAVRAVEKGRHGRSTSAFWSGAIAAVARGLYPSSKGFRWSPPTASLRQFVDCAEPPPAAVLDGSVIYCIPLSAEHVLLTPHSESWVRVYTAQLAVDDVIECVAFPSASMSPQYELADTDIEPFFEGLSPAVPGWYTTRRRAKLRVLARDGDVWLARVISSGILKQLVQTPAVQTPPQARAPFRVLREGPRYSLDAPANDQAHIVEPRGEEIEVLGLLTRFVATDSPSHPLALLRYARQDTEAAIAAVRAEYELFQTLQELAPLGDTGLVASSAGVGRLTPHSVAWPCYSIPAGVWPPREPIERKWIREDDYSLFRFLQRVAGLICHVHAAGFSLGAVALSEFAIGVEWSLDTGAPEPVPTLITAPVTARFEESYRPVLANNGEHSNSVDVFQTLNVSIFPPPVAVGAPASKTTDALAFAAFALDLLLDAPLRVPMAPLWDYIAPELEKRQPPMVGNVDLVSYFARLFRMPYESGRALHFLYSLADPETSYTLWRQLASNQAYTHANEF